MSQRLSTLTEAADLRSLNHEQLRELAEEIRERILSVTAANGGHLASSLGTVELTLALHYAFDTPRDRLVWDVGHQTYAHKLVTGRADRFDTIRLPGGLSGFLKRDESPYDAFGAGHASTAISAALGMAVARDRHAEDYRIAAIVGDGSMTGGICYEALNNAGMLETDLLVVLNDNTMSISPNVGAVTHLFNRLITANFYNERRRDALDFIKRLPAGERLLHLTSRIEESIKGLIVPGGLFEDLGMRYIGPIDGHNLDELIPILQKLRTFKGPILLHVLTTKGKGRPYTEADPTRWHSPPLNFNHANGHAPQPPPAPPTFSRVFADALAEEARRDERIVAVTAAMGEGTGLIAFGREFPDRLHDVGIAEEHAVLFAAGMACDGLRPFVPIYSTFMQRAFDMIVHDVALQKLPVVLALDRAGLVGSDGPTHHGAYDLSWLRVIPDLIVMAPRNGTELRDMVHTAAHHTGGPIALRYPRGSAGAPPEDRPARIIEIGRGEVLREGDDVCLIGIGNMTVCALEAAERLTERGIAVGVLDARFLKPLDTDMLMDAARRYRRWVTLEDNAAAGGFGSAIIEWLTASRSNLDEADLATPEVVVLGLPDRFIEHGSVADLHHQCGLSPDRVAERVAAWVG